MGRTPRIILGITLSLVLVCLPLIAQHRGGGGGGGGHAYHASGGAPVYGGGYGGYGGNLVFGGPYNSLPNYWWVGRYPSENPCQAGCNPNAGYEWDSVGTLILDTNPPQARVTLDGIYAGTTDNLGPFQLPVGLTQLPLSHGISQILSPVPGSNSSTDPQGHTR